jgi:hypothetical protein
LRWPSLADWNILRPGHLSFVGRPSRDTHWPKIAAEFRLDVEDRLAAILPASAGTDFDYAILQSFENRF